MGGLAGLSLLLLIRGLSMDLAASEGPNPAVQVGPGVGAMVAVTAFDVNDQTLTLRCRILNRSDHDIWVCEGVKVRQHEFDGTDSEIYMDPDARTLVIARWIEAPMQVKYVRPPDFEGRYVRVRAGQERTETLSLAVPVNRRGFFSSPGPRVNCATRLVLRIGFYERDLAEGLAMEKVIIPYRSWFAPASGAERYLEMTIDGVFIDVV
ncbi:MAG: hypothetical protein FJ280_31885 [Planctomycetes bacterium]|nr:hypothetical protein [Planctomycetota bacterium]